ncbi:MAG TPA: ATP-binding protein, partial [Anaerolineales bacterium]|nr:ATP-binding protein [Anaerolineales bacterium]
MLEILDNGLVVQNDVFSHLWFCLRDANQQERFRAITLRELTALVIDDQELADYNVLGKQWGAMRGVYGAGVDYVYTAAGIFTPEHVGVVQFYGAAGDGASLDEAVRRAHTHLGAVEATLSNFPQSQTRPPLTRWMEWYLEFVTQRTQNVVAIL